MNCISVMQFSYSKSPNSLLALDPLQNNSTPPPHPLKKKPRDLNFERRHAMFATPHVKATLLFFVPKQSNFFSCVLHRASKS
jgi:hypothetical protein